MDKTKQVEFNTIYTVQFSKVLKLVGSKERERKYTRSDKSGKVRELKGMQRKQMLFLLNG